MIPTGYEHEALWKLLAGMLVGVLVGGFGGGLLVWAAWQWMIKRTRFLWTSVRSTMAAPEKISGKKFEGSPNLGSAD